MSKYLLVLSIVWLVFCILHRVLSGKFWIWALPNLAPPIIFAIMPLLILGSCLFVANRRETIALVALISFVISLNSTGLNFNVFIPKTTPDLSETDVHIVQLNTDYWGQLREALLTDPRDTEAMLAFLRKLDADIYLLQEHTKRVGDRAVPIAEISDVQRVFPEYNIVSEGTLLTITRFPVLKSNIVDPDNPSKIQLPPPPYGLRTDIDINGKTLSTYNMHVPIPVNIDLDWISSEFFIEMRHRHTLRTHEYKALESSIVENHNPLIIAGDFNTTPTMGDNRRLLDLTRDAAKKGNSIYPSTWRVGGQLPRFWRNDWVLVRNDLEVIRFESLDPEGNSDHLVQSFYLRLN